MATKKQEQVKSKVKKLLLGKKELLVDGEENSVEEQYMFNVDGQEDDSAFDPSQRDGLTRHFRAITWGGQAKNKQRDYDGQSIIVHQRMQKRVEALERTHGRKWEMVYAKRADQDKRGQEYMRDGYAIILRKTNASLDDYKSLVIAAVSAGFSGIEIQPAGSERIAILDARPQTKPGTLNLKLSSGGAQAIDLHPARLLFGENVYGDSVILFSQQDIEEARVESGTSGDNVSRHFFQLVKKSTGLENYKEVNGRYPYIDELRDLNTQRSAFKGQTASGTDTARIAADQPVTLLYNKPVVKKAEEDASAIIQGMTGGRGMTEPEAEPAAVQAVGTLPSFSQYKTEDIQQLQKMLTELGFDTQGIDGKMGSRTKYAITQFQDANGLATDGVVGPRTLAKLNSEHAALSSSGPAAAAPTASSSSGGSWGGGASTTTTSAPAQKGFFGKAIDNFMNWAQKDNNMKGVVIPASVLLAVGIGGAFAWRKFVRGRKNRELARRLARDRMVQREMEMLLRQQSVPVDMLRGNRDFMRTVQDMERAENMSGQTGRYLGGYY